MVAGASMVGSSAPAIVRLGRGGTDGSESFRRPWGDGSKDQNGPKVAGRRVPVLMAWRFATPGVGTCNLL